MLYCTVLDVALYSAGCSSITSWTRHTTSRGVRNVVHVMNYTRLLSSRLTTDFEEQKCNSCRK